MNSLSKPISNKQRLANLLGVPLRKDVLGYVLVYIEDTKAWGNQLLCKNGWCNNFHGRCITSKKYELYISTFGKFEKLKVNRG